jgi:hypothetical protein
MTDNQPLEKPGAYSLLLNYLPLVHLSGGVAMAFAFQGMAVLWFLLAWVYLLPPVLGRLALVAFDVPSGELTQESRGYKVWWFLTQLQMVFNRVPLLEEVLRLVPGLYPLWISIWGGKLSQFAYVAPRVIITDRYLVNVHWGAVLGFKSALAGHMAVRRDDGRYVVIVAAPTVEREAIVGGDAGLGPGATLRAGHLLPTGRRVGPFDEWPRRARSET